VAALLLVVPLQRVLVGWCGEITRQLDDGERNCGDDDNDKNQIERSATYIYMQCIYMRL